MADFRKWFIAFVVLAFMLGASTAYAQLSGGSSSVTCNTTPSNNTIVRAEGIAEEVGDFVLQCTGGVPTSAGVQIPQIDIQLTVNANVTSRLLGAGYIDALLTIDEPFPTTPNQPAKNAVNQAQGSPTGQAVCFSNGASNPGGAAASAPANCNVMFGTFNTGPAQALLTGGVQGNFSGSPYDPSNPIAVSQDTTAKGGGNGPFNIFVAHQASASQVIWNGVPVDAPGTAGVRVLRMTNVRVNACLVPAGSSLVPASIVGFVSILGSNNLTINGNGQQSLAIVESGFSTTGATGVNAVAAQCTSLNTGFLGTSVSGSAVSSITVTEGFPNAFKPKSIISKTTVNDVSDNTNFAIAQNVPGANYNTESGLQPPTPTTLPTGVTAPSGAGAQLFGFASAGTRILITFNAIGTGTNIFLPLYVPLTGGVPTTGNSALFAGYTGGWLELIGSSDVNGNITSLSPTATGSFSTTTPFITTNFTTSPFKVATAAPWISAYNLPVGTTGVASAVYEVANADPFAIESATIPVGFAYKTTSPTSPPQGQSTATVSFAPLSTVNAADPAAPVPRFCNKSTAFNVLNITPCTCNLLFPFVTNQQGFDTGIAIANTTLDIYKTVPQTGTVTLNYFGNTTGGGAAPAAQTTAAVTGGTEVTFTLGLGGDHTVAATQGFQGYIIAQAGFQYCHGYAFITYNFGTSSGVAEGYLALEIDTPGIVRTGNVGEVAAH